MMKQEFAEVKEALDRIGIVKICTDFYREPRRRGSRFFVKSPVMPDKTWSCALYPNNRFCDFSNGNVSGDCIGLIAYIRDCSQWRALNLLKEFYGIASDRERNREEWKRIAQQEEERQKKKQWQQFHSALSGCTQKLKETLEIFTWALDKQIFEPFSDEWVCCYEKKQAAEYRLDILTAADCSYRRLKEFKKDTSDLPSDRPAWLLDCLVILEENGFFRATEAELAELRRQQAFELTRNKGQERRCFLEW